MKRLVLFLTILIFTLAPLAVHASIHGILTGKVTGEDKKPIAGASVQVLGTTRGTYSKADGKYTIANIVAGRYDVRVTFMGLDTIVKRGVIISAEQTVTLDFVMTIGAITKKVVDIWGDKDLVRNDAVGTVNVIRSSEVTALARDNLAAVVSLMPGIVASGNNFIVRGSRSTETQVMVDGLTMTDQFEGGLGRSGSTLSPAMPSPFATAEVQAQTGGFGAEYGNALGGIVNTVVKTGRNDKYEALVRWRVDVPGAFGYAGNGIQAGAPQEDIADVTFGGPIPLLDNSTFFLAVRNTYNTYRNFGLQVLDPIGNNLGMMPNNRTWARNVTGRLKFNFTPQISLLVGGMFGLLSGERAGWGWLYANDRAVVVDPSSGDPILDASGNRQYYGEPERNVKQVAIQELNDNIFAQLNHSLNATTFYEVRASLNRKTSETGRRSRFGSPGIFSGFDMLYPEDTRLFDQSGQEDWVFRPYITANDTIPIRNAILDHYEFAMKPALTDDGMAVFERAVINPLTGYVEGPGDAQSTLNPYGLFNYFNARGNEWGIDMRRSTFFQFDGSITHVYDAGDTRHYIKAGLEARTFELTRHYNGNPWDGQPFYDIYGSDYGENVYIQAIPGTDSAKVKAATETPFRPYTLNAFVQDQITFGKHLIFTPGLRFDYLSSNSEYRTSFSQFLPFGIDTGFSSTTGRLYISPRVSVAYPAGDRANFTLSYGIYYQAPPWSDFYDAFYVSQLRGSSAVGNPNLEMQRSNQYQISYSNQFTDEMAIVATGFFKDIYNQSGLAYVRVLPNPYFQRILADYGTSRGIELTLQKRVTDNWGFNVNYTLQSATGTANSSDVAAGLDPQTDDPAIPLDDIPLSFDRRHRINLNFTLSWGNDEGPSIAGVKFLENLAASVSGFWQTGLPYTPVDIRRQAIGPINSARFPSNWNSELRVTKTFGLKNLLGSETFLDVFVDVFNLFNYTGAVSFHTTTGSPDYDGINLNRRIGDFPNATYFRDADPIRKETVAQGQYDRAGRRLYNALADVNGDGLFTTDEQYLGYQKYVETVVARRNLYQFPRQVYFGVAIRFN